MGELEAILYSKGKIEWEDYRNGELEARIYRWNEEGWGHDRYKKGKIYRRYFFKRPNVKFLLIQFDEKEIPYSGMRWDEKWEKIRPPQNEVE